MADNLRLQLRRFGSQALHNPLDMPAANKEHRAIFDAIKALEPEKAEQLVREHYLNGTGRLIKHMSRSLYVGILAG